MIAAVETFWIFLLIAAGSAFFNWLKKKNEPPGESQVPDSYPRTTPGTSKSTTTPRQAIHWEEELRKMLDLPTAAPSPAPPLIVQKTPPPRPFAASFKLPVRPASIRQTSLPEEINEEDTGLRVASWGSSDRVYEEASRLEQKTIAHLRDVTRKPVGSTHIDSFTERAPEVAQMLSLLRSPRGARQAMIALAILGPPKSLES